MSADDNKPHDPPGTGTGPAGGAAVKPSLPARDPKAEADALAAFEADEKALAEKDEPKGKSDTEMAKVASKPEPKGVPAKADATHEPKPEAKPDGKVEAKPEAKSDTKPEAKSDAKPEAIAPTVSGGTKMAPLGPPTKKPPVVSFDKVTKSYGKFTAIKDVSFSIEDYPGRGEFVSILGPSGCGKSTVIRLIAGLLPQFPQSSGTVLVDGKPIIGPGPDRGMVFQDYTSFDNRSVIENVAFGLECRGMDKGERLDRARFWISKVGLSVKKDAYKYPHELSGGMRQRVAIARTLILQPRIILMDEPFGALDPPTRTRMQDNLVELWREQSPTIFFITHSVEEAVYLGDHILLFSSSPGTVQKTIRVPPPDRPSIEMQRDRHFQEVVSGIRETIDTLESSSRAGD